MTDEEIGLVKAMVKRGIRNDTIHFYFNRSDRLISSGRIAQIKMGKYGASVQEAAPEALDVFLQAHEHLASRPASPVGRSTVMKLFSETAGAWRVDVGETDQIECKRNFRLNPEVRFADAIRSIAGLANNRGGYIPFGVTNGSLAVDGLADDTFSTTDPAEINRTLAGALDPVPHVTKGQIDIVGKIVGILYVERHEHAPVIALKNIGNDVKEGAIYYRYVGETRAIKPGELRQIIARREQAAIAEFSRRMTRVAAGAEATLNLDTGEVRGKSGSFIIDRALLPSIQFLREGDFSEVKGTPALKLIGDVEPVDMAEKARVRIIRDNVTPDAVIRNFLRGQAVSDPMQYIHAHAHCQRRWLPVWHYVKQAGLPVDSIVEDLRSQVASHPSSRDAVVQRLRKIETAYKLHVGKPAGLRTAFARGEIVEPKTNDDDLPFANAVMGLPPDAQGVERFKPMLLLSLDRTEAAGNSAVRSAIYRAACRLDELLNA